MEIISEHNKQEYPPMHTAEHVLNQTMVRMFGCGRSMNAHIEKKKSKCDYILPVAPTQEQVEELERRANDVLAMNLPVSIKHVPIEEASAYVDLSKLPEGTEGDIRLVFIGDYDICACVGAHVNNTSEVGRFKIISHDFEDGRWRVRFKLEE